jgi:hypothetical protein
MLSIVNNCSIYPYHRLCNGFQILHAPKGFWGHHGSV